MAAALGVGAIVAATLVLPALRDGLRGRPRPRGGAASAILISLPEYLLAPILMLVLAVYLRILPPFGWGGPEKVIMPALSLGLPTGGYLGGLVSDAVTATFSDAGWPPGPPPASAAGPWPGPSCGGPWRH